MEEVRSSILLSSTHNYAVLAPAGTAFCIFGHAGEPLPLDGSPPEARSEPYSPASSDVAIGKGYWCGLHLKSASLSLTTPPG